MLSLQEAQSRLLVMCVAADAEQRAVDECAGYYLTEPLLAKRTQPMADMSAMDGFAVCGASQIRFRIAGESAAGHPFARPLVQGEAVRISTGAVIPGGASSIWPGEICEEAGDAVILKGEAPAPPDRFIRPAGSDFQAGDRLLQQGQRIGPATIALALTAGHSTLPVRRRVRVAILETGDELASGQAVTGAHHTPACNGAMVAAMLRALPCAVRVLPVVPDRPYTLRDALETCSHEDVVVTIGGASVGRHDLVAQTLDDWGADLAYWRVAMKPGKPLLVARRGRQLVLGLPGNPASAFVTAFLFLLPAVRGLLGAADPLPAPLHLPLGFACPAGGSRCEFLRARIGDGQLFLSGGQQSGLVHSLALAEYLIEREAGAPLNFSGDMVKCYALN